MKQEIIINPVTRVGGNLEISVRLEQGFISKALVSSLSRRGIEEKILGCPVDTAPMLASRICGGCGFSHFTAASRIVEQCKANQPKNEGLGNWLLVVHLIEGHLRNFYYGILPDYANLGGGLPMAMSGAALDCRFNSSQIHCLETNRNKVMAELRKIREAASRFTGKWRHGLLEIGAIHRQDAFLLRNIGTTLSELANLLTKDVFMLQEVYQDYRSIGGGSTNFIDLGCFPGYCPEGRFLSPIRQGRIEKEHISLDNTHCWKSEQDDLDYGKQGAYSQLFLAEYQHIPFEMGPLARQRLTGNCGGSSVMDRILAVSQEVSQLTKLLPVFMEQAGAEGNGHKMMRAKASKWREGKVVGLAPSCGGTVMHMAEVKKGRIAAYKIISPCHWNFGPQDRQGNPSPLQTALLGTLAPDEETADIALRRIVHSFTPCLYCGG